MGPLKNTKILCFAVNLPGAMFAYRLRLLGARVIKIEPPTGDPLEHHFPACYRFLCKGMKILILDRDKLSSKLKIEKELASCQLFFTACRKSTLPKLQWDWKNIHRRFPRLNMLSMFGYPAPYQDLPGHDLTYQASAGFVFPPSLPHTSTSDVAGMQEALIQALLLLRTGEKTRKGNFQTISLSQSLDWFSFPIKQGLFKKGSLLREGFPLYHVYPAKKGWVALAAIEPHFQKIVREELSPTLSFSALKRIFKAKSAADWENWARKRGLPLVRVRSSG